MTPIGRHDADFPTLVAEAVRAALSGDSRPRTAFVASFAPRELCGIGDVVATARDVIHSVSGEPAPSCVGPFRTGGEALFRALEHMKHADEEVLVVGCEKMTHLDSVRAAGLLAGRVSDVVEQQHRATLPALAALATSVYAGAARVPLRAFDDVAVKNHEHACLNPLAHFRSHITADEVRRSPLVADPLRRYHCAPMSDGAAACILSHREGAVRVSGWGRGVDVSRFHERTHLGAFRAAALAASEAFSMSGRSPSDVHVVEIHDAFSPFELMNLEAMGFFAPGEAWRALARGHLTVGGPVAVNPSGGMKARGHPIGACGLTSLVEVDAQLRARAGARQQPGAAVAAIQSAGGVSPETWVFVLEACA